MRGEKVPATARLSVLTAGGPEAWAVINYLAGEGYEVSVFLERKERRLARRNLPRCARSRWFDRFLPVAGRKSLKMARPNLVAGPVTKCTQWIPSTTSERRRRCRPSPDVILLVGCRLMTSQTIAGTGGVPLLNLHPAILPQYRGHHGGYWALAWRTTAISAARCILSTPGLIPAPCKAGPRRS